MEIRGINRGDVCYIAFGDQAGAVLSGTRPALVIQNDAGNRNNSTVIVAAISSKDRNPLRPTHIKLGRMFGLHPNSVLMLEQLLTVDKSMVGEHLGHASPLLQKKVDRALAISIGLGGNRKKSPTTKVS